MALRYLKKTSNNKCTEATPEDANHFLARRVGRPAWNLSKYRAKLFYEMIKQKFVFRKVTENTIEFSKVCRNILSASLKEDSTKLIGRLSCSKMIQNTLPKPSGAVSGKF